MASIDTGNAQAAKLLRDYFVDSFLQRLDYELIAGDLMSAETVRPNSGLQVVFHRVQNLPLRIAGISGGAGQGFGSAHQDIHTTAGRLFGTTYAIDVVSVPLSLMGNDMELTELNIITAEPNIIPELTDVFFRNGAASLEQRYLNLMVCSSVNGVSQTGTVPAIQYNGASVSVGTVWGDGSATLTEATLNADLPTHRISVESINQATHTLRNQRALKHQSLGAFAGLITVGQATELRLDSTFQELAVKGGQPGGIAKFESASIGTVFGVKLMETPMLSGGDVAGVIDGTNDEIHRAIVFGAGYAKRITHATGVGKPNVTFMPPKPDRADVYGLNGFLMWKLYMAGVVTNPLAGCLIKTATTNVSNTTGGDAVNWQ